MKILGISCYYHDAAAALVDDGHIVAAAQEERFSRIKHDAAFPHHAVRYCLAEAGLTEGRGPDAVVFYDKPMLTFHRLLETYLSVAPAGLRSFMTALPVWITDKLWTEPNLMAQLRRCGISDPIELHYGAHHESHGASAFYPSPFQEAAVLTIDGVGEWACATVGVGAGATYKILQQQDFPHSLGLLYSAFTYYTGFRVNSGEYKLMGLAPYGEPAYVERIYDKLLDLKEDGSFRLNMDYFGYLDGLVMTSERFAALFDGPPRAPESRITRREMDLARSIQQVTEEIVLRMARHARRLTDKSNLCLAGGVALNCVANGRLLRQAGFDDVWIQPAAGDAGGALGCALNLWHNVLANPRQSDNKTDKMQGSYLGPGFSEGQIRAWLDASGHAYTELDDAQWASQLAALIAEGKVLGLFNGRMEFGPRALGARSIVGDPRSESMQSLMNLKIKQRESFRPFAPSCLAERAADYFDMDRASPYMMLVATVHERLRLPPQGDEAELDLHSRIHRPRSTVPAITHVDYSARLQTVDGQHNPRFYALLQAFERLTGCALLINTSFNVRGEPIVCTPADAFACFMNTEMDHLVLDRFLLSKQDQSQPKAGRSQTFELD